MFMSLTYPEDLRKCSKHGFEQNKVFMRPCWFETPHQFYQNGQKYYRTTLYIYQQKPDLQLEKNLNARASMYYADLVSVSLSLLYFKREGLSSTSL